MRAIIYILGIQGKSTIYVTCRGACIKENENVHVLIFWIRENESKRSFTRNKSISTSLKNALFSLERGDKYRLLQLRRRRRRRGNARQQPPDRVAAGGPRTPGKIGAATTHERARAKRDNHDQWNKALCLCASRLQKALHDLGTRALLSLTLSSSGRARATVPGTLKRTAGKSRGSVWSRAASPATLAAII